MNEKEIIDNWVLMSGVALAALAVGIGLLIYWQKKMFSKYKDESYWWLLSNGNAHHYKPHVAKKAWLDGLAPRIAARKMIEESRRSTD